MSSTQVEQFLLTDPEKSWDAFEEMIAISEEFYKTLGVPYRVVAIVSGALNNAAAKKFDLEAWFPFQGEYKELVSCSNCTDYQSRALEIRFGAKVQTEIRKKYVHALNSTLCATERALCCLLENFQTEDVVAFPYHSQSFILSVTLGIQRTRTTAKVSTRCTSVHTIHKRASQGFNFTESERQGGKGPETCCSACWWRRHRGCREIEES
jgi:seryl-tRNA synthetase